MHAPSKHPLNIFRSQKQRKQFFGSCQIVAQTLMIAKDKTEKKLCAVSIWTLNKLNDQYYAIYICALAQIHALFIKTSGNYCKIKAIFVLTSTFYFKTFILSPVQVSKCNI